MSSSSTRTSNAGAYATGHRDGFLECLDELEDRAGKIAGSYRGPLPAELRSWIERARRRGGRRNPKRKAPA